MHENGEHYKGHFSVANEKNDTEAEEVTNDYVPIYNTKINRIKKLCTVTKYYASNDKYSIEIDYRDKTSEIIRRMRLEMVIYNPSINKPAFIIGIVFKSTWQFRDVVSKYSNLKGCKVDLSKNENVMIN